MRILDRLSSENMKMIIKKLATIGTLVLICTALISIVGCAKEETAREGYETYSRYGFSFEYPRSFLLFEQGVLESQANDTSGLVSAGVENEETNLIYVWWMKAQEWMVDLETGIEDGFLSMEDFEDVVSVERGELVETTKAGHRMLYRYYSVTFTDGVKVFGIYGEWYCDKDQKIYDLYTMNSTISNKEDVLKDYQSYLDYFVCH